MLLSFFFGKFSRLLLLRFDNTCCRKIGSIYIQIKQHHIETIIADGVGKYIL